MKLDINEEKKIYAEFLASKHISQESEIASLEKSKIDEVQEIVISQKNIQNKDFPIENKSISPYIMSDLQTSTLKDMNSATIQYSACTQPHPDLIHASETTKQTIKAFISRLKEMSSLRKIGEIGNKKVFQSIDDITFGISKSEKKWKWIKKIRLRYMRPFKLILFFMKKLLKNNTFIIHPYNFYKVFWDMIQFFTMIFFFFYLPLDLVFQFSDSKTIRSVLSLFMLFDNCLGFRTAYFHHGKLITDWKKIYKAYILHFIFDLVTQASLIYDVFFGGKADDLRFIKLIFFIQYRKFKHIYQTLIDFFKIDMKFGFLLDFINLMATSICIMHWVACGWCSVSIFAGETKTWFDLPLVSDAGPLYKYLIAFYWSAVTMMTVGYGDIIPQNHSETLFATFVVMIGCGLFAYYIKYIIK